jgi:peroxiredoxin
MSTTEPVGRIVAAQRVGRTASEPPHPPPLTLVTKNAVAVLVLTSIHHAYGAHRYATPWRLHVLLLAIPAIFVIQGARRRLLRPGTDLAARWIFVLTTLVVPVLGIGAFEGFYNHLVKDLLFFLGARASVMTRLFPPPTYEMPNDVFFEVTGVAQALWGGATAWHLLRFVRLVWAGQRPGRAGPRGSTYVGPHSLSTISGRPAQVPDPSAWIHLQFRRFAGCPVCNVHLHAFVRRHDELRAAGVREVVVFHSSAEELREHAADLPFAVVPDPDKLLYAEFGVESSPRAVLDPRAWGAIVRGVLRSLIAALRGKAKLPAIRPRGGGLGLPADFLIAPDGRVVAAKYGVHADDQWSVGEVLAFARAASRAPAAVAGEA